MGATIKLMKDGPAIISGTKEFPTISIEHEDGTVTETQKSYAICRCGYSKNKPLCDGAHAKKGYRLPEQSSRVEFKNLDSSRGLSE